MTLRNTLVAALTLAVWRAVIVKRATQRCQTTLTAAVRSTAACRVEHHRCTASTAAGGVSRVGCRSSARSGICHTSARSGARSGCYRMSARSDGWRGLGYAQGRKDVGQVLCRYVTRETAPLEVLCAVNSEHSCLRQHLQV
jgi:hypothetical protein